MIKNKFLLSFLLILAISSLQSQSVIKGKITDGNTPLAFVNVYIENTNIGSFSNDNGYFELTNIPLGEQTLVFSAVGYKPFKKTIAVAVQNKALHIVLDPSSENLDEVVITGTLKPTFVSASPVKIEVVTAKKLETFLPTASSSIVESVKLINGVQEVVACGVCFTNSISINGLPGAYTAILIDGTPIYGNLASVYGLNGIPNMIIDRIEIIKGPSSTLYGSEAVAGVINIITKNPESQPLLHLDIMTTSHYESFGNIAIAPKTKIADGYIGYNYAVINEFDDFNNDGFGDMINLDRHSVFTKWNFKRKSNKKFTLGAKYYYEDRRNGVEEYLKNKAYKQIRGSDSIYGESIYTNRLEFFGSYEFNTTNPLRLDFSVSTHEQDSYYGSDYYKANQDIVFANLIYNKTFKKHDIVAGITNRYQFYDDNTVATETAAKNNPDKQFIPGIFVQDEWEISPKVTLLNGGRLDHYKDHGLIFSPRVNLKYKPSTWSTLRGNFGTGFRIVNLFTEDHAFVTGQREVIIEESLKPEKSFNGALNFNHIFNLLGGSGSLDVDAYYTYFTNKILPDYDTNGQIIYRNSNGFAQTRGVGASVNYAFQFPLSFTLGANFQKTTQTEKDENNIKNTSDVEFAPKWTGVFNANYQFKKIHLDISYSLDVTGEMQLPEVYDLDSNGNPVDQARPTTSKPFAFHNLQTNLKLFKNASMYAGIQNIFNYRQKYSPLIGVNDPNFSPGFSPNFDTSYAYSPIHGREFYFGFTMTID
jgi:outer membrane receptor for ferrienterochelin and colicins